MIIGYTTKRGKRYNFSKYSLPIVFLRDVHEENDLKGMRIGEILVEKRSFLSNTWLLFSAREKSLMTLEAKYIQ